MRSISIQSLKRIDKAAKEFLKATEFIPVIAFSGELGAGKTTFIQALCRGLGVKTDVNSPTFSLVNEYFTEDGSSIYHFDLYRIEDPAELFDLGYEEYFYGNGITVVFLNDGGATCFLVTGKKPIKRKTQVHFGQCIPVRS